VNARLRVVSGTLLVGMGEVLDSTVVRTLAPGDTMLVHRGMTHYEGTKGETVLEVTGSGAWGITFVDPARDPARRTPGS
jgi:hypothetical protein